MPSSLDQIALPQIRELAHEGRLVETAFDVFRKMVFPGAGPDQVNAMRICFFAGAAEIYALMMASLDEGEDPTGGDLAFMGQWTAEIEAFHRRVLETVSAGGEAS